MKLERCTRGLCKTCPEEQTCKGILKESKYKNKKIVVDGIVFDSKKEAKRYQELLLMQRAGIITDLKRQVPYILVPAFNLNKKRYRETKYLSDFTYFDKEINRWVVEDVKGSKITRTPLYMLKKKLFLYEYGEEYEFREVI